MTQKRELAHNVHSFFQHTAWLHLTHEATYKDYAAQAAPEYPSNKKNATPKDLPSAAVVPRGRCLHLRISRRYICFINYACAQRIKNIAFILCVSQSVVGDRGLKLSSLPLSLKYPPRVHRSVMIIRPIFSRCRCTRSAEMIFSSRFASSSVLRKNEIERARSEQEENQRWAKEPGARDVLAQPPFGSMTGDTSRMLDSLEEYLQARRWHHPKGPARRFLSHLLTFPLTLATGLREVGLGVPLDYKAYSGEKNSTGAADGHSITVACIGARAESSLPPEFWRETLFALPTVSSLDIHHIGPEVSHPSGLVPPTGSPGSTLPSPLARVDMGGRTVNISWTRALLGEESISCVDPGDSPETKGRIAAAEHSLAKSDAVVLFNPGLGHPHLRKGWEGALKRLLYTGKPLIVTCHSRTDLDRDVGHFHDFAKRWCIGRGLKVFPRENPFRSLIVTEGPLKSAPEIVSSNWGTFVVPRGAKRSE